MARRSIALLSLVLAAAAVILTRPLVAQEQDGAKPTAAPAAESAGPFGPNQTAPAATAAADETEATDTPSAPQIDRSRWPKLDSLRVEPAGVERAIAAGDGAGMAPISVDSAELRRTLVYLVGSKELRSFKLDVNIEAEIARQVAEGRDPAEFEVSEAELDEIIERTIEGIRTQYPTLDPVDVLRVNKIHLGSLRRMTRQTRLFTRVFLPSDPNKWPDITVESMRAAGQGPVVDQMKAQFSELERKIEAGELTPEEVAGARQGQQTLLQLMGQSVIQALDKSDVVLTAADGLPVEVAMRVNGRDVLTERVFDEIADRVTADDIELARTWTIKCALAERVLAARGFLLTSGEAAKRYEEHMAPLTGTIFPPEFFIIQVKGFPSMQLYQHHNRLLSSYQDMIASEIDEAALRRHFDERANELLNVSKVGTEVILLSAYDFSKGTWKENGWADAERRAREVAQKLLDSGGSNWGELQDEYSDFWDPPAPTNPGQSQPMERLDKGRFAPMARNELLGKLGENEFTLFLDGTSVTDELFYFTAEGTMGGPWKGRWGWYIGRVTARVAPQGKRDFSEPEMREMVLQDYVNQRFNAFVREIHEAAVLPQ